MEVLKTSSKDRGRKTAWVGDHLGARAANAARSSALRDDGFNFSAMFDRKSLDKIKKDAARGPLGTQLGSFKEVLESAEKTAKLFDAYQNDEKVSRGLLAKSTRVTADELTQKFDSLIVEAQKWLKSFNEDGEREKLGKVSDNTVAPDKHRAAKIQACKDLIAGARISIAQLKRAQLEDSVKGFPQQLVFLETLKLEIAKGNPKPGTVDLCRQVDADVLQQVCGTQPAGGGTSEVGLIMAPDGSVAYAFKSIENEAPSMGIPKGGGAIREVLASRLCDQIKNGPSQLDFGWPACSLATLAGLDRQKKAGVLIDGLNGKKIYDADALASVEDPEELARKKKQSVELFQALPPVEIQKVLMCNLAFVQFDIKWDNAIIEDTPDGPQARPYDGGAALPPQDVFMDIALFRPGTKGLNLLTDIDGNEHPAAQLPLDPALKKQFLAIDLNGMAGAMSQALGETSKAGLDGHALGAVDGCKLTLESIQGIHKILLADTDGTMTLTQFLDACESQVFAPMAASRRDEWLHAKVEGYVALQKKYPKLLRDAGDFQNQDNIWLNFMKPDQLRCLDDIVRLGADAVLQQYGVAQPIPVMSSPKTTLATLGNKMPKDYVNAHPEIWPRVKVKTQVG